MVVQSRINPYFYLPSQLHSHICTIIAQLIVLKLSVCNTEYFFLSNPNFSRRI